MLLQLMLTRLLMLQIYRTGVILNYMIRLVGDGWNEGQIERS